MKVTEEQNELVYETLLYTNTVHLYGGIAQEKWGK